MSRTASDRLPWPTTGRWSGSPADWSFTEAAAVPTTFLTAYYGLVDLAALRPGEAVLIHRAADGVGMAAVRLAQGLGAEVYGTAPREQWDILRALGLDEEHIFSSGEDGFVARFLASTGGRGVDLVLRPSPHGPGGHLAASVAARRSAPGDRQG